MLSPRYSSPCCPGLFHRLSTKPPRTRPSCSGGVAVERRRLAAQRTNITLSPSTLILPKPSDLSVPQLAAIRFHPLLTKMEPPTKRHTIVKAEIEYLERLDAYEFAKETTGGQTPVASGSGIPKGPVKRKSGAENGGAAPFLTASSADGESPQTNRSKRIKHETKATPIGEDMSMSEDEQPSSASTRSTIPTGSSRAAPPPTWQDFQPIRPPLQIQPQRSRAYLEAKYGGNNPEDDIVRMF